MRVLLVNPFYPISETPSPPLGLAFLAAALETAGVKVRIVDFVVFPYSKAYLETVLNDFQPHMLGVTAVTMNVDHAAVVVRDAKQIDPRLTTVMGGPHITFLPEATLQTLPELDVAVLGEGEGTLVEMVQAHQKGSGFGSVRGIVFRQDGRLVSTGPRETKMDLDTLPVPARHLIPLGRYRALGMPISMTTSRGCPFKCIFCVGRQMVGSRVRYRDPAKVVDELSYLASLGFHQVNIADDLFTANHGHCAAVCDEILRRGLQVNWTTFARVDTVSPEILSKMKAAGVSAVSFGIESANPEILKTIRKGITIEQVLAAVKMCNDAGVTPFGSFILGLPGETPETLRETVEFSRKLKEMNCATGFHLLAPFPGTVVREKSREYGITILSDNWADYHANRAIVVTDSVTKEMLDKIVIQWEEEYNEFLGTIKKRIQRNEATEEEAFPLVNLERIVLYYDLMMKRVIEQRGKMDNGHRPVSDAEAVRLLCGRIGDQADCSREQLEKALAYALGRSFLRYKQSGGRISWEWIDNLPPLGG